MESAPLCPVRAGHLPPAPGRGTSQKARHKAAWESDKDSGYSDVASEGLSSVEQTDSEEGPAAGPRNAEDPSGHAHTRTPPVGVLQKVLVDQGSGHKPPVQSWTIRPSLQLLPSSPQILLFPPASSKTPKYLPVLNSYAKIAPHPPQRSAKRGADTFRPGPASGLHSGGPGHKRKCRAASLPFRTKNQERLMPAEVLGCEAADKGHGGPTLAETVDTGCGVTSNQETSAPTVQPARSADPQNKSRRFQNTLGVLHHSGLLGIAMKTKELMRLNQVTQRQLEKLQQQVELYSRAVSGNELQHWQKLQDSLAEGERDAPAARTE
ncbi:CLOCK-interacting pacemaker [Spea bombifrons]|uniref:CLOCK-interacting pacemaker n=1 Tax=Spea bombifrons TaxID=233779 RepID=UPI0023490217|nr:CLOCK-interacting pacemaker [Spea bombifrons]XP_053330955.1 CLOCK-interacting pacemaker [Spea bombifrons]XP_053330956.1 CLOCK-interacting pacemaker [Spea bombifrons]XP_053330958.1 CLOCK-interacting pacemaker [Spea bombifrons]XP_053330959.1 CLOCK-interacting pacemaker [Spea bombifrons]